MKDTQNGIPLINQSNRQIIIEVMETSEPGQYQYRTRWENMEHDTFETILQIVLGAANQIAHVWADASAKQAAQQAQQRIHMPVIVPPGVKH